MLWLVICLVGLLAETALIVVLGRRATGAYGALPAGEQDAGVRRRSRP
ncbi:MAG: hypothetical protein ACJ71Y_00500 [Blastococcus sp.]